MRQHHCPERGSRGPSHPSGISPASASVQRALAATIHAHTVPSQTARPLTPPFHFSQASFQAFILTDLQSKVEWRGMNGELLQWKENLL